MNKNSDSFFCEWRNVVVTAETHNPSLLNPDFLKRNGIIPEDWEVTETFTTPPVSSVLCNNIRIFLDQHRLEIKEHILDYTIPDNTYIYDISYRIVNLLEFVIYKSIGLNWNIHIPNENHEKWIIDKFVKNDVFKNLSAQLKSTKLTFTFEEQDNTALNLTIAPHYSKSNKIEGGVVNYNANYSHSIPEEYIGKRKGIEFIQNTIQSWKLKEKDLFNTINKIIKE